MRAHDHMRQRQTSGATRQPAIASPLLLSLLLLLPLLTTAAVALIAPASTLTTPSDPLPLASPPPTPTIVADPAAAPAPVVASPPPQPPPHSSPLSPSALATSPPFAAAQQAEASTLASVAVPSLRPPVRAGEVTSDREGSQPQPQPQPVAAAAAASAPSSASSKASSSSVADRLRSLGEGSLARLKRARDGLATAADISNRLPLHRPPRTATSPSNAAPTQLHATINAQAPLDSSSKQAGETAAATESAVETTTIPPVAASASPSAASSSAPTPPLASMLTESKSSEAAAGRPAMMEEGLAAPTQSSSSSSSSESMVASILPSAPPHPTSHSLDSVAEAPSQSATPTAVSMQSMQEGNSSLEAKAEEGSQSASLAPPPLPSRRADASRTRGGSGRPRRKDRSDNSALHYSAPLGDESASASPLASALPPLDAGLMPNIGRVLNNKRDTPSPPAASRPRLDMSHVDGDADVLRSLAASSPRSTAAAAASPDLASASWLSGLWSPLLGALLLLALFTITCFQRLVNVARAWRLAGPPLSRGESWLQRLTAQLSAFDLQKKLGAASPSSDARTRQLAAMSFDDVKSRRRGVKAGLGLSATPPLDDTEIELQSLTSSLASLHMPKMLYLPQQQHAGGDANCLLTPDRLRQLLPYFPAASHIQDLELKYSLSLCGASLNDLYRRCSDAQDALTIIQDSAGYIFGCYASFGWSPHATYYGNGECFVFQLHPIFHVYPASGANSFFQLAGRESLAIGGGDHFAIWIDENLRQGHSKPCQTFASTTLSSEEEFRCYELEVWSFVDSQGW